MEEETAMLPETNLPAMQGSDVPEPGTRLHETCKFGLEEKFCFGFYLRYNSECEVCNKGEVAQEQN